VAGNSSTSVTATFNLGGGVPTVGSLTPNQLRCRSGSVGPPSRAEPW
jgi:hypothetical protein